MSEEKENLGEDLEDIFGDDSSYKNEDVFDGPSSKFSKSSSKTKDSDKLEFSKLNPYIPSLLDGRNYPEEFIKIVQKCNSSLSKYPVVDYEEISEELSTLSIRSSKTPTLDIISEEISRAQAIQDRLTEIYVQIVPICSVKKRYLELLKLAWMNYAKGGSKDKREGDASSILIEYEVDYAETDSLRSALLQVIKNVESILHSYSRRITVFQIQSKNGDFGGRSNMPEINFEKDFKDEDLERSLNLESDDDYKNEEVNEE